MRKIVIAMVISPVLLMLALPASTMLINEVRLWVFANQLSELDEFFEREFRVLATGSEVYQSGTGEYCGFTATRLYSHYESKENLGKIKKIIDEKNFKTAKKTQDKSPVYRRAYFSNKYLAVTLFDKPYDAGLDVRCW